MKEDQNWFEAQKKREMDPVRLEMEQEKGIPAWIFGDWAALLPLGFVVLGCALFAWFVFTKDDYEDLIFASMVASVCGPLFFWPGLTGYYAEKRGRRGARVPVTATIVEVVHRKSKGRGSPATYTPIYAYTLAGRQIRVKGRGKNTNSRKYKVGQQMEMLVAPDDPKKYDIPRESVNEQRFNACMMAGGGLAMLAAVAMWGIILLEL